MNNLNFGIIHIFKILFIKSLYFRNQEREFPFRKKEILGKKWVIDN